MRLTPRDVCVVSAIYDYRVLRRDQIQRVFFPSKNTANERLKLLHAHGYLARRRLPVEYGQGSSQALYLLATKGAQLVAERLGVDLADIGWKRSQNHVSTLFLEHMLMVNDVRIAFELGARYQGYRVERWTREDELKAAPDRVRVELRPSRQSHVRLVPDAYGCLRFGQRRTHFLLEADRATETNGRWAQKVRTYLEYVRSGAYVRRYHTDCLRVLTVTTSEHRLRNLLATTAKAGGSPIFWFTHLAQVQPETILHAPIWHVPRQPAPQSFLAVSCQPTLVADDIPAHLCQS